MGELNKQTCFRKHSSFVLSLWPTCLPTHSSRPSLTRPSLNSLSPLQTSPPSSLPSRLAGSLIPSLARVRSLSSPRLTRPSPSCPMQHSLICWILPTRRSWMPFSPTFVAGVAAFSKDLTDGEKIKTVEGQDVTASIYMGNRVFINNALVTTADVSASNGVIHIIDKVLSLPPAPAPVPTKTIVDLAVATADLSTLVAALKAGGLVETLSGKGPFTVFAPTNEAFGKLPKATLAHLLEPANKKELDAILTYHVASGVAAFSKDLTDGEKIKTVEGQSVTASISAAGVMINGATV